MFYCLFNQFKKLTCYNIINLKIETDIMDNKQFLKLIVARAVNYAFWLLVLTLVEDQTSLYISNLWLWLLAPIMMVIFGTLSARYFKTTVGFALMRIKMKPPVNFKEALIAALPWTKPKNLDYSQTIPSWRYFIASLIGASALVLQYNDPVYGFSSSGNLQNSSWVQYTHEQKGFSIYFPDDPKEENKPLTPSGDTGLEYTEMSSKEKKGTYSVSFLKMPKKWGLAGDNTILKVSLDLIAKNTPNAQIVDRKMTTYQGLKAIDYTIKVDNKEMTGRLLVHKNTLYKLNIEYPEGASNKVLKDDFLSSFSIQS
jgi:hypothetical protein